MRFALEAGERGRDRGEGRGDAAFQATERGKTKRHQLSLQRPQVVVAECKLAGQVVNTGLKCLSLDPRSPVRHKVSRLRVDVC